MALVPFPGPHSAAHRTPPDDDLDDEESGAKMSFLEHLDELRKRIINACIAIGIGFIVSFAFVDRIFNFIFAPTRKVLPPGVTLAYTRPSEAFSLYIQVALIGGILLAAPVVMYQVWLFIAPGLYSKEKRFAIPFVLLTTGGFFLGAAFNHYLAFPSMMWFFASFNSSSLQFIPKVEDTFDLYLTMILWMGVVFQMPTIVFFLAKMRLVTARFLWNQLRYAILLTFIVAAVITPTGDPMNQTIFAAPMIGLYLVSIVIAWLVNPRNRVKEADESADAR
jgi:sec-independent protein translocase protein TatC